MESLSVVTLGERELDVHLAEATRRIHAFSGPAGQPEGQAEKPRSAGRSVAYRPLQSVHGTTSPQRRPTLSLADRIQAIHVGDELYSDVEHRVLRILRRSVQVYLALHQAYERQSGLDRLKDQNRAGTLPQRSQAELEEKVETAAAVSLFALSAYLFARLRDELRSETEVLSFEVAAPDGLALRGRSGSLDAALAALHAAVDGHARDDASLVKAVRDAAHGLAEHVRSLQHSLQYLEFYSRYHYRIDPDDVALSGFELAEPATRSAILVPEKRPEEVVGNHVAKLEAARLAQRLACYDGERQSNPFVELGGFAFTFIGDGSPGTGKTTLIQMIVTLLREYTEVAGLPLRYENFSIDEISDYQGRSGQNAARFCQSVMDPRIVGFGSIDDVDQVCGNRNDKNASAGQLEVTAVFMQEFAGAKTVVRGNASFGLFSNFPEKVDDALRQRTQARFQVDGPRSLADYTDLLHILLHRDLSLSGGRDWEPLAAQRVREVIQEKYGEHAEPRSGPLRAIKQRIHDAHGGLTTWPALGAYLHALGEHSPSFTGRAVKNISDAVRSRMMDFDLPQEWLSHREPFFDQPYETRVAMLRELRGEISAEIVLQEINRYADSEARYADSEKDRLLLTRTEEILLDSRARQAAAERIAGK